MNQFEEQKKIDDGRMINYITMMFFFFTFLFFFLWALTGIGVL